MSKRKQCKIELNLPARVNKYRGERQMENTSKPEGPIYINMNPNQAKAVAEPFVTEEEANMQRILYLCRWVGRNTYPNKAENADVALQELTGRLMNLQIMTSVDEI